MDSKLRPETLCIQAGYTPKNGEPRQIPIVQSTTFKYDTCEAMGQLFDLEAEGYFYSRLQNPTCDMVAAKIYALEGGTAAMLTSSGQAANFFALFNLASNGDHMLPAAPVPGGSPRSRPRQKNPSGWQTPCPCRRLRDKIPLRVCRLIPAAENTPRPSRA